MKFYNQQVNPDERDKRGEEGETGGGMGGMDRGMNPDETDTM